MALGGTSEEYNGRMLHPAHAGLGIPDQAFDQFLDHLAAVLAAAGVAAKTSATILAILQPVRTDVVQPPVGASSR